MKDLWRLLKLFRPYAAWIALGILASLATLLANVTLMAISGWFIASMAAAGAAQASMNYFTPAAIIRGSAIARTAGRYVERLVTHEATLRQLAGLRVWFYRRLEPLAPARLQQYRDGDLLSRIRADIDTLDNFYLRILAPSVSALLGSALMLLFLMTYEPRLALVLGLGLFSAGILLPLMTQRMGSAPGRRKLALLSEMRAAGIDGIQGMAELQAYDRAEAHARHMQDLSRRLLGSQARLSAINGMSMALMGLLANLSLWLMLWIAIPLVRESRLAPPELAMLALFTLAAFEAVAPLPAAFQALGETRAAANRLFEIVDADPAVTEPVSPAPPPREFDIRVENLVFRYPDADRPALNGIDLQLAEGERLAVIGPTGCGKSTLLHLLLRFWAPQQGRISLGGRDIASMAGEELRRRMAVVSQHTHLFSGTIRENLLLADPQADQESLAQACRTAQIEDFIESLPDGYETWLGESGVNLSGGQARRLAIARALLKDSPILLLDEPTEGLDPVTERELLETLETLMRKRSVMLISHRPAALQRMDRVLIMQGGQIADGGAHLDLMNRSLDYAEFLASPRT